MNEERKNEVVNVLLQNTVGYHQYPDVHPYPNKKEFKEAGVALFAETKGEIITLVDGTKCRKIGESRTWGGFKQYDAYICEDGSLVAF